MNKVYRNSKSLSINVDRLLLFLYISEVIKMAVDKDLKELASTILKISGKDHDTWLTEQYQGLINNSAKLITNSLKANADMQR